MTLNSAGETATTGKHAIVLGASMAGLLAARVLADYYARVTVIERDTLDDTAAVRRGCGKAVTPMGCSCGARKRWRSCSPAFWSNWSTTALRCLKHPGESGDFPS
jgi:hypothetical protein